MTDDFANHPKSIGEVCASKSHDAMDWAPRDVLIQALRRIDSGEIKPECLAVVYAEKLEGGTKSGYSTTLLQSGNALMVDGMLSRTILPSSD